MANDKACKLLGCSSQELIGQKLSCLIYKSSQDIREAVGEEYIETDECSSVASGTVVREMFKQIFPTIYSVFIGFGLGVWFFFLNFQYNFLMYLTLRAFGSYVICRTVLFKSLQMWECTGQKMVWEAPVRALQLPTYIITMT